MTQANIACPLVLFFLAGIPEIGCCLAFKAARGAKPVRPEIPGAAMAGIGAVLVFFTPRK